MGAGAGVHCRQNLQEEVQDANEPETRWHGSRECQTACPTVLPAEDGTLPYGQVPLLDEVLADCPVLVVPASQTDKRAPFERVPKVEEGAEDTVEGGVEGDGEGETVVEGPQAFC